MRQTAIIPSRLHVANTTCGSRKQMLLTCDVRCWSTSLWLRMLAAAKIVTGMCFEDLESKKRRMHDQRTGGIYHF